MIRYLLAIVFFFNCLMASADEALPKELPRDQEAVAIKAAETMGLLVYRHDQAAAAATDAALKLRKFKKDKRIEGWITEQRSDQIVVTFIDEKATALYRVPVSEEGMAGPVSALDTPATLSAYEAGAAAARRAALELEFQPCSEKYNTVVLPSGDVSENRWVVYLIPGTTKNNVVPLGGTYRVEISGSNVVSQRGFTRSCIALQTGEQVDSLITTHLLDPIPTEAHVFWSLWAKKSIYVATPPHGTIWAVEGESIRLVQRKESEG